MNTSPVERRLLTFLHEREKVMDAYIEVLELQKNDLEVSNMDNFYVHSRMEEELIERLEALQKVIRPLRERRNRGNEHVYEAGTAADSQNADDNRAATSAGFLGKNAAVTSAGFQNDGSGEGEIDRLESRFEEKRSTALKKMDENRNRIQSELGNLQRQLDNLRSFSVRTGANYASGGGHTPSPRYIDFEQ